MHIVNKVLMYLTLQKYQRNEIRKRTEDHRNKAWEESGKSIGSNILTFVYNNNTFKKYR